MAPKATLKKNIWLGILTCIYLLKFIKTKPLLLENPTDHLQKNIALTPLCYSR
jgi:hypothetical protein